MTDIEKQNKTCRQCGNEYEAHFGHIAGITIEFGHGYCPECRKKLLDEEEKRDTGNKLKQLNSQREKWRVSCGIPLRYQVSRFANFDISVSGSIRKVMKICQEYADKFLPHTPTKSLSLVLYSRNTWGVGKTYLACSIAHEILDKWMGEPQYCPIMFVSEPQLFLRVRSTFNRREGETEEEIYRQLSSTPLLILDDVGKEEVSDPRFVQRVLFSVIDSRYQKMLPIVITANLDTDGLDKHLGGDRGNSASMDRIVEMTGNNFYELIGESYRDISKRINTHKETI